MESPHPIPAPGGGGPCQRVAAPVPLHANRGNGRTYTDADRRRSHETSTNGRLTNGHLFANPIFHHLDGRDLRCAADGPVRSRGSSAAARRASAARPEL